MGLKGKQLKYIEFEHEDDHSFQYNNDLKLDKKWSKTSSSIYFFKKKKREDLHLDLTKAKMVQLRSLRLQEQKEGKKSTIATNVDLLKKSYVKLIGEYELLRKKIKLT